MQPSQHHARVLGSLLGLAVGDCLGAPLEGQSAGSIRDQHGTVSDFLYPRPIWTDDTQQALTLVESVVRRGSPDPSWIGRRWAEMAEPALGRPFGLHRGTGRGFRAAVGEFRIHQDWRTSGRPDRAGNGSAMRIAPLATALANLPDDVFIPTIIDVSLLTHRDLRGIAAALAVAKLATQLWAEPGFPLPAPRGRALLEGLASWLREEEARLSQHPNVAPPTSPSHVHDLSTALVGVARRFDEGPEAWLTWIERYASSRLGRAAHATEGFALCSPVTAIALVVGSGRGFGDTLVQAVNLGHDADTVGAMVGGLAGAAAGDRAIPARWRRIEGFDALVAWGGALARRTALAEPPLHQPEVGQEDQLPDVLALERRLTVLLEVERKRTAG